MMGAYGVLKNGDSVELHWNDNSDVLSSVAGMKVFSTADNRNAQEDAEDFANLLAAGIDCPGDGWYATKVDGTSCCLMMSARKELIPDGFSMTSSDHALSAWLNALYSAYDNSAEKALRVCACRASAVQLILTRNCYNSLNFLHPFCHVSVFPSA